MILELLYGTGIRLAELLQLSDHDIDFNQSVIKVLGKRNKERIVPLSVSLKKLLKEYIDDKIMVSFSDQSATLIVNKNGESPSYVGIQSG